MKVRVIGPRPARLYFESAELVQHCALPSAALTEPAQDPSVGLACSGYEVEIARSGRPASAASKILCSLEVANRMLSAA
jgi:hypothetical protein